jgi:hypothetical protein
MIDRDKEPKKRKTIEESWQEGRANLIKQLIEHRRAIERMAIEQKVEKDDRQAILTCATFAYYELMRSAGERERGES